MLQPRRSRHLLTPRSLSSEELAHHLSHQAQLSSEEPVRQLQAAAVSSEALQPNHQLLDSLAEPSLPTQPQQLRLIQLQHLRAHSLAMPQQTEAHSHRSSAELLLNQHLQALSLVRVHLQQARVCSLRVAKARGKLLHHRLEAPACSVERRLEMHLVARTACLAVGSQLLPASATERENHQQVDLELAALSEEIHKAVPLVVLLRQASEPHHNQLKAAHLAATIP